MEDVDFNQELIKDYKKTIYLIVFFWYNRYDRNSFYRGAYYEKKDITISNFYIYSYVYMQ